METTSISVSRFLKTKLEKLQEKNKSYSLRAFAQRIELSPGGLAQIFSGKKKLSLERAHLIAGILKLTGDEKALFLLSVEFEQARSQERKAEILLKLQGLKSNKISSYFDLSIDQFRLISDWYGLATFECLSSYGNKFNDKDLSAHFGMTLNEASLIIDRLVRLELIEKNEKGYWKRVKDRMLITSNVPSETLRKHHQAISQLSSKSFEEQTPQEKVCGTEVFAFDMAQFDEVKKITDEYLDKLQEIAAKGKNKKATYQAIVNVFRISKKQENKK